MWHTWDAWLVHCELSIERVRHDKKEQKAQEETVERISSSNGSDESTDDESSSTQSTLKRLRFTKNIVRPLAMAVLECTKLSHR